MTQKEKVELREIEITAEGRFFQNSGGHKWGYYGDVIDCMSAGEEKRYFRLIEKREQADCSRVNNSSKIESAAGVFSHG